MDKNPFVLFSLRGFDLIKEYGIENEVTIEYPFELTPYQKEEPSSEPLEIIKLKDNSNFILSMISLGLSDVFKKIDNFAQRNEIFSS
jgi:hypothetical protein